CPISASSYASEDRTKSRQIATRWPGRSKLPRKKPYFWSVAHAIRIGGGLARAHLSSLGEAHSARRVLRSRACEVLFLAHRVSFSLVSEAARRRTTVHGQFGPSARPLISSTVIVTWPRSDVPGAHLKI